MRITGLATGLDTDNMIKQMMKPYVMRVDKMKQDRQIVQWRQDLYRDIIENTNSFKKNYFDILKSDKYMLSSNSIAAFNVDGITNNSLKVSAGATAKTGDYEVTVKYLAEPAKLEGMKNINVVTVASAPFDKNINPKNEKIETGVNDTLNIRIGNTVKTITLDSGTSDIDNLVKNVNDKLKDIGINTLTVDKNADGKMVFKSTSEDQISIYGNASSVIGAYDNFEISMKGTAKVTDIIDPLKTSVSFKINGKDFTYDFKVADKDKTIDQLISDINSKAGVKMSYSTANKKFSIESNETGASASLSVEDISGDFLNTLFGVSNKAKTGKDAEVTVKGPDGTSSTYLKPQNTFEVDGVTYTLNTAGTGTTKFSLTQNIDESFNKIKSFIDDYNKLIDDINKKITEKRQYKYLPLTEEQKKDMKENDIKSWEDKAKEGLIRNDPDLSNMLNSLRRSFFDQVEGTGLSLRDIGLDTSSNYLDNGKIIIDEVKLKEALKTKGDKVAEIFTKKSTSYPRYDGSMPNANRTTRYNEEGIFQRINDILEDYTRTTSGKGVLLNKAGIKGDFTNTNNILSEDLKKRDKRISEMEAKLADRENKYYLQFAQLEKAMERMNSQSAWFAQQFGGGQK